MTNLESYSDEKQVQMNGNFPFLAPRTIDGFEEQEDQ